MPQANRSVSTTESDVAGRPSAPGRRGRRPALDADERRRLAALIARMVLVDGREQKEVLQHLKQAEPDLPHLDASTVSRLYRYALDSG
ncbi:MAG: hypothetical protein KGK12_15240, partial [Armatimonadetes bacterium]|nr:hypothetical protein [Armatimonadota bacterium]